MNKFVIRNKVKFAINCAYFCLFYILLCYLENGVRADKEPHEIVQESFSTEDSQPQNIVSNIIYNTYR